MNASAEDIRELLEGLQKSENEKEISPKYFYDERGSQLFDQITRLPEYYPTDTEIEIMRSNIGEMVELIGPQASIIEFGAGSSVKVRILLENLKELAAFVPVDISEEHLLAAAAEMQKEFPDVPIHPVAADFTKPFDLPSPELMPIRNIVYFPGSTIGNFTEEDALGLLKVMHHEAGEGGALLIGVDLQKDPRIIEDAYNDSQGVTAEFNRNMLHHLNREFGADFDVGSFKHDAKYDEDEGRVVLRLISEKRQAVTIGGEEVTIAKDEGILTEYSHKYTLEGFAAMAEAAGFRVEKVWTDPEKLFSVQFLVRD
ncbi:MAG: L-histidine N(alpha)-methyltransferase [Pseudomonadota bacterium]